MLNLMQHKLNKNIAHIALGIGPTSCVYNEHFLPVIDLNTRLIVFGGNKGYDHGDQIIYCHCSAVRFYRALISMMKLGYVFNVHFVHLSALMIFLSPFFTKIIKVRRRTVVTMHTSWPNYKCINKIYFLISCIFYTKIIFCSKTSYGSNPRWVKILIGKKYEIIENGLNISRLDRSKLSKSLYLNKNIFNGTNKNLVVSCGRLVKSKGFDIVIKAFGELCMKDTILVIVGDGPEIEDLKDMAIKLKSGKDIVFCGQMERDQLYKMLNFCNFYISASVVEGLPVALLEAMAARCFPILTDIPQHLDVVPRRNAEYFKKGSVESAANALKKALAYSEIHKSKILDENRFIAESKFAHEKMLEKYYKVYQKVN